MTSPTLPQIVEPTDGRSGAKAPSGCQSSGPQPAAPSSQSGIPNADFLTQLRRVNAARLSAWEGGTKADPLFHAAELGGEVGELLNVAKKLHREAMGWRGSRATMTDMAEEVGDVLICLDKLAAQFGIDLASATASKFNQTSDKVGLPHKLVDPRWRCEHCGALQGADSETCRPPFKVQGHAFTGEHPADRHAAQGIEAATADETRSGSAVGESPVAEGDAPEPNDRTHLLSLGEGV